MTEPRTVRQRLAMSTIRLARRAFFGTPVERLPIVGRLRGLVYRYGFGGGDLTATIHGLQFRLPPGDVSLGPSFVGGYYEELELGIYEALARESSVIADVGGNIGLYSCIGAAAMPTGRVVAFEPAPANLDFLRQNVAGSQLEERVAVVAAAVSDEPGQARLYLSTSIGNHSLAAGSGGTGRHVDVQVTTIDDYFAGERVDVLKVDVEGFEFHVLKGARQTLAAHKPAVFIELISGRLEDSGVIASDLIELLTDLYDHIFVIDEIHGTVSPTTREDLQKLANGYTHTNLVAVSRAEHRAVLDSFGGGRTRPFGPARTIRKRGSRR